MTKRIVTVGFSLANDDVHYAQSSSRASLLDWDIALFRCSLWDWIEIGFTTEFQGKYCLSDSNSFQIKEAAAHWRREINEASENGKTIIIFLSQIEEVYVATGDHTYSGTGKNRQTTRHVEIFTNYEFVPLKIQSISTHGSAMRLTQLGSTLVGEYWSEFGISSQYKTIITNKIGKSLIETRTGSKPVSTLIINASGGSIVLLPDMDFSPSEFFDAEGSELVFNRAARAFASRFVKAVVDLDTALKAGSNVTPAPPWALEDAYCTKAELEIRQRLLHAEEAVERAQREKDTLLTDLSSARSLRPLLYETGKPLEIAIINALEILGFEASGYRDDRSEFDVVFRSDEGRLLGEAEGRDSKPISIDKLRQLSMNIHEDLAREDISVPAKGILFGNGFRLSTLGSRACQFTDKCVSAAQSTNIGLVATSDLFHRARYVHDTNDADFAARCRAALISSVGICALPDLPDAEGDGSEVNMAVTEDGRE